MYAVSVSRFWPQFTKFCGNVAAHSQLKDCFLFVLCRVSLRRYLHLSRDIVVKPPEIGSFGPPRFRGGGVTPNFGHPFSNLAHCRTCGEVWLQSSVQRAPRVAFEKKKVNRQNIMACHAFARAVITSHLTFARAAITSHLTYCRLGQGKTVYTDRTRST